MDKITLGEAIVYSSFLIGFIYFLIKSYLEKRKTNG